MGHGERPSGFGRARSDAGLLVSADGKSYSVALHDTSEGDGLFSVFSDQNGIIFLGSPL
jgi:hypothetical protein